MSNLPFWFGYPADPNAIVAWAARAIFCPDQATPLDLLPDRQSYQGDYEELLCNQLAKEVNAILPMLNEFAEYYSPSSTEMFRWTFPWPHDDSLVLSAAGSPNGSYGYFYVSVSLVPRDKAQSDIRPRGYMTAVERAEAQRQADLKQAEQDALDRKWRQIRSEGRKEARQKIQETLGTSTPVPVGVSLNVGDRCSVAVNQGQRQALVRAIAGEEALIEYWMPNGRSFFRALNRVTHEMVGGSIPRRALHKKFVLA